MIDNRFYTVEAQAIAENWWQSCYKSMRDDNEGLDFLVDAIEAALVAAEKRGFDKGLSQQQSEAAAAKESHDDNHNNA
jgi:hypothetical protein